MRFIGSKSKLLQDIEKLLNKKLQGNESTFLDLFAGTNTVGNYFKKQFTIFSNDLLYFSFVNAKATIENNDKIQFKSLKNVGIESPLDYLQEEAEIYLKSGQIGYYESSYTPTGNAMYLSIDNGKRIDFIRDKIDEWRIQKLVTESEFYYLVSVLIEAIPFVSNTTGTYGAFLKHWDKRALKPLVLEPLEVLNNKKSNKAYNLDANILVKDMIVDIAYIDTPYNNRQYASNYHLLENIARNNKPDLKGKTKIAPWTDQKSSYAMKGKALEAMTKLINDINATHIILSYNNEGIIPEEELLDLLKANSLNGSIEVVKIPYRKYKSKKPSETYELYEMLIYFQKKEICLEASAKNPINNSENYWKLEKKKLIKSPLNYIGGKYKLLNQILPLFPNKIDTFVDLFSGGANVGINVDAKYHIFNDMNNRINEMFRYFSSSTPDELIDAIKSRINEYGLSKHNEKGYLKFRYDYNKKPNPLDLYVLVSYSYNYQFRFNNSMEFNNPFGRNRSQFSHNMEKNLRLFVSKLDNIDATFVDGLFSDLDLSELSKDDFVYLDPPYLITTGNYNDGNRGFVNWGIKQELTMYDLMNRLTSQGVRWALSNVIEHKGKSNDYLKKFITDNEVAVHYLDFNYDNSSHNSNGTGSIEVLVTNYNIENYELLKTNLNSNLKSVLIK